MDLENEKRQEEMSAEQKAGGREGYRASEASDGYQSNRSVGRSPRPRINQARVYNQDRRGGYSRYNNDNDEGGFRPEGFGAGLQSASQQRPYRPRFNNNDGDYRQPHNNYGGNRGGYNQERPAYRPRFNNGGEGEQGGYRPRFNNGGNRGGYNQERPAYRPRFNNGGEGEQGGYQPRNNYGGNRGGYNQERPAYRPRFNNGGEGEQGGYQPRNNYGGNRGGYNNRGGYGQQRGGYRQRTADYDPHAKYSMKKRIEYKEEHYDPNEPIRLNKFLANAGVCSRREADEFIQAGVVTVNGEVITELGSKVMRTDTVMFHDQPVSPEKKVYVLLNKPKDHVTTSDDPQQRKTVMDLVKDACTERIYPVGRLDRNTTGVLLLTNDGDLASKLTHPKFLKKKVYHVYLDKNVTAHDLQQIRDGIMLDDGEIKADAVEYADPVDKKQVGIEIHSGKNRIVRRIFEHLGYKVTKLDRVLFAGLTKKNLRRGDWRYLTEEEVNRLRMGAYE
ncbi:MAG: RNA-binding S4 domain-containing protein [Prevotella sp.]|nr:RNA-binding S4 domain-containing protein [Prevotella sp.]